ncbi:MAG: type II toxin-antitoxin system HicA family toxin [Calditrichaeota bacterium]|nr:type II toxin-antitoxin system HicA family toxin [Calditrichota bacterium]
MIALPIVSGKDCIKVLKKIGYYIKRRESSHIVMRRDYPFTQVIVPDHKELDRGTLRAILRQADLSIERFNDLLRD